MFHYSAYWRTWSRKLGHDEKGQVIELNLTTTHNQASMWQGQVACGRIRKHNTTPEKSDKTVSELPVDIYQMMVANISEEKVKWLLSYDFLSNIDWQLFEKNNNGGCAFSKCKKKDRLQ